MNSHKKNILKPCSITRNYQVVYAKLLCGGMVSYQIYYIVVINTIFISYYPRPLVSVITYDVSCYMSC
jgi:hypothetical protein